MRIIAGTHRGRRLSVPRGDATRPTSDRVRESIFGILGDLEDARILDLFAGSGAMGLEALSRGARDATFVERRRATIAVLRRNLTDLDLADRATVVPAPVARASKWLDPPYDVVFADPPYDMIASGRLVAELRAGARGARWGRAGSLFVLEHRSKDEPPALGETLCVELEQTRRYGGTSVSFYRWSSEG
jgi:16S rRNA (guanine966-N2)-methyltransferase